MLIAPFPSTTNERMAGRNVRIISCPPCPSVSSAVESASVSVADGNTTAERSAAFTG